MLLDTLQVRVVRANGNLALKQRRVLRIVERGPSYREALCVARHKQAILVVRIIDHETVEVDMKAKRIDLSDTRVATPADLTVGGTMASAAA